MLNQKIDIASLPVAPTMHWSENFGAWLRESGRMPKTIDAYVQDMRHYFRYFGEVNAVNVKAYFAMQDVDNTVKPSSRNRRLASLRVFVKWAVEQGMLDADPTVGVKRVEVELSPRDRTPDEIDSMTRAVEAGAHLRCATDFHAWLGARDAVIWNLFNGAGLRIGEIAGLMINDVDLHERKIHVLGKGGKKADVIISVELVSVIASWLDRMPKSVTGHLVTDSHGHGITRSQVWRRIKEIGAAGGVDDIRPHDLRHTYVYRIIDRALKLGNELPVALDVARKQSRHSDVRTTMKFYMHARDSHIRAVVDSQ